MTAQLLAILLSTFIGFAFVSAIWEAARFCRFSFWIKLSLSIGLGFGITSLDFFFSLPATRLPSRFFIIVEVVSLLVVLWAWSICQSQSVHRSRLDGDSVKEAGMIRAILLVIFCALVVTSVSKYTTDTICSFNGGWDSFTIWNLRAEYLFRGGPLWKNAFSSLLGHHPDYPLLLSASVARLWRCAGGETLFGPQILAFLFTFATLGLLVSSLAALRGPTGAIIGGSLLLICRVFTIHGSEQYADVPIGFFYLATIVLLCLSETPGQREQRGLLLLAGIAAGFAAWTKNEGILFLLAFFGAYMASSLLFANGRGKTFPFRELLSMMMGLSPVALTLLYFKLTLAPTNDLVAGQGVHETIAKLADITRYALTGKAFLTEFFYLQGVPLALLPALAMFFGVDLSRFKGVGVRTAIFTLFLVFSGYFFAYITTPWPLKWHLDTSLERLFMQLWPGAIFLFIMVARNPAEQTGSITLRLKDLQGRLT